MHILLKISFAFMVIGMASGCSMQQTNDPVPNSKVGQRDPHCQVNTMIERLPVPKTPNQMSLPAFGQGIIGWATGPEGAKSRLEGVSKADIANFESKGVTLAMVQEWQVFYENEVQRNPCNPTAPYRAELMKKIAKLWVE